MAAIFGIVAFLSKNDVKLKILAALSALFFAIHFYLIGSNTGFIICLVSVFRFLAAINNKNQYLPIIFILFYLIFGIYMYEKLPDIFAIFSGIIGTIAVFYFSQIRMRKMIFFVNISWFIHDAMYFSLGGMMLECFLIIANMTTIYRMSKFNKISNNISK